MRRSTAVLMSLLGMAFSPATAQTGGSAASPDLTPNSEITLISESEQLRAGAKTTVALRITIDRGWHTYWTNPGDAGLPLTAKWILPSGVSVSSLRFPVPHVLPQPPLMSYGYEQELLVLADVDVAQSVAPGTIIALAADVDFLVCADVCLPATGHVTLSTRVGTESRPSPWASVISQTRGRGIRSGADWQTTVWRTGGAVMLMTQFPDSMRTALRAAYLIPDSADVLDHAAAQRVVISGDTLIMALTPARRLADTASQFSGVLLTDASTSAIGVQLQAPITRAPRGAARLIALLDGPGGVRTGGAGTVSAAGASAGLTATSGPIPESMPSADMGIWLAMLLAFVGGVILNLMPCVFPVLSVKILAFVERGRDDDGRLGRRHAMVFTAGVLTMFWLLAGVLLALRAGGAQLGWGFQLQSPVVVTVLALVVFALALNLSGVFAMGMSFTRLGAVGSGERYSDSFLTGLLAVVVATPCTAPFMGAALGYALVQPAAIGFAVFTSLGVGLAAPYFALTSSPALLRKLPRPGPWLESFKQLLAFPLYATVVWLLWVLSRQVGPDQQAVVLLFAVGLSLAGWSAGRAQNTGRSITSAVSLAFVLLTIGAAGVAMGSRPAIGATATGNEARWERWSAARVAAARDSGRAVFVDFTAAWCLSCQVNERIALNTDAVGRAFADGNVLLLRADWTSRDAEITALLASFGRSGVPLYVLYPASASRAEVLPAVLTPGIVIEAVTRAAAQQRSGNVAARH